MNAEEVISPVTRKQRRIADLRETVKRVHIPDMFEEAKMTILRCSLMVVGMFLAVGGVVAVFNFDQPSDTFSSAWWMIVGGWCLAFIGMGMDIVHLFKTSKREPMYVLQPELIRLKESKKK